MDTSTIQRAIAFGNTVDKLEPYEIRASGPPLAMNREKVKMGGYTTPFLRVALATYQAKRVYETFTWEQVTDAMTRPVLEVYAISIPRRGITGAPQPVIGNVQAIVITKAGQREPVIRPTETAVLPVLWRNLLGFSAETTGLQATFPLDALSEENEVHLIYDAKVGIGRLCDDCKMRFNLDKVR